MTPPGWSDLHRRWARSAPPLRPHAQAVAAYRDALSGIDGSILLLGVTPELADAFARLVAVDWSAAMIARVWPGDSGTRRAVEQDWRTMTPPGAPFTAVVGDGALNMLDWPDDYARVRERLDALVAPGGRIVLRCFVAPDAPEEVTDIPAGGAFHAFKLRLMMAAARGDNNVAMRAVFDAFQRRCPDRAALSRASGWSLETIAEIDDYASSFGTMSFPTRAQLEGMFPGARFAPSGDYPLAERCPLMVVTR